MTAKATTLSDAIDQLRTIALEIELSSGADLSSIKKLHKVAESLVALADSFSFGQSKLVDIKEVWPEDDDRSILNHFNLPIHLGISTENKKLVVDLAKLPSLLIGGKSGYGKTNLLNSIISGLARLHSPREVKFILFDPKCSEFTGYCELPHLAFQVITEEYKCIYALLSLNREIDRRLKMFASVLCRNIEAFNNRNNVEHQKAIKDCFGEDYQENKNIPVYTPYIVVVMDEIANLVSRFGDKFIQLIRRLTSYGRSAGIHLVAATQFANDQSLPFALRDCFRYRIALKTHTEDESYMLVDSPFATVLCSRGDILIRPDEGEVIRSQSPFLHPHRISEIIETSKKTYHVSSAPYVTPGITFHSDSSAEKRQISKIDDEDLYKGALDVIRVSGKASVSHFQRQLNIGFNHANDLVNKLVARGIIEEGDSIGYRKIKGSFEDFL